MIFIVLLLDQKYQKSSASDASPRSEKTAQIQAKGAGHNANMIIADSLCFQGIIPCKQSALGRACFAGFVVVFSFTLAPARRSRRPTHPTWLDVEAKVVSLVELI